MNGSASKSAGVLAQRISTNLPQYLVSLAHEPSVGLYFLCTHAKARAAPALASTTEQVKKRSVTISTTSLDVKDAVVTLRDGMVSAEKLLKSVQNEISEASQLLSPQNNIAVIY